MKKRERVEEIRAREAPRIALAAVVAVVTALAVAALFGMERRAQAAACAADHIRWASSSNTVYVTGAVDCTLTDISQKASTSALQLVDPGNRIWLLKANLRLEQGARLNLHGASVGGDVNELRLRSNNSSAANSTIFIRAQWGTIDIVNTRVTSWNEAVNAPDTETATYKRSYIHARSFLEADGVTARESRMNIRNSDVGYLGFYGGEAYGLVWKVIGSTAGLYDKVNVYGDVTNSYIHHNFFGAYTYGAFGMEWRDNEIAYNASYGLDPHDDSDSLVITGNETHHNGNHGIICSQRCDNLTITGNVSHHNTGHGIMLHRDTNDSLVANNQSYDNTDTGIVLFESHRNTVRQNVSRNNKRGIRLSVGSADNVFENNEVYGNVDGLYFYKGSDAPVNGDGHPKRNRFANNDVRDNSGYGIKASESDDNTFVNNSFTGNGAGILFEDSLRNRLDGNTIPSNRKIETDGNSGVASSTFVRPLADVLLAFNSYGSTTLEDSAGRVFDPEEPGIATTVTSAGSTLKMTKSLAGDTSLVTALKLWALAASGSATIDPTLYERSGDRRKEWVTRASSSNATIAYTVGDLAASTSYTVRRNGSTLATVATDSGGTLRFSDAPGSTSSVTYRIEPGGSAPTPTPTTASSSPTSTPTLPGATATPTRTPTATNTPAASTPTATAAAPTPAPFVLTLEAESGTIVAPMTVVNDSSAGGGKYIVQTSSSGAGTATYTITVPAGGNYQVKAKVRTTDASGDSVFVSWDGGANVAWELGAPWSTWTWRSGPTQTLSAGTHTLRITHREPNVRIDRIEVRLR
jgi:parallel beta-helix repeat protein